MLKQQNYLKTSGCPNRSREMAREKQTYIKHRWKTIEIKAATKFQTQYSMKAKPLENISCNDNCLVITIDKKFSFIEHTTRVEKSRPN